MAQVKSKAKCPKCGSIDLQLMEVTEALKFFQQNAGIYDDNDCESDFGTVLGVHGVCVKCNHHWKLRVTQITHLIIEED